MEDTMRYHNPIIPGFYPDPSICKKGDDYYLVTSSFEFFPGVPIFHSKDLVNWKQIGHCLTRKSQLDLDKVPCSKGIYAPTIRYNPHDDLFYMVTTNVGKGGNFYVTAKDPAGEWSDPIWVEQGGIDPSFFFDDDGNAHFISNARDRGVHAAGFLCAPIDLKTGKFLRPATPLWGGIGENAPEAPHIYKIGDWYYQMIAEGGTELGHMVTIARSRELYGKYESCPYNPILTHRNRKGDIIQATGHADLIEDNDGNWWAVFLGYRQTHQYFHHLGRETFLAPVTWRDGWPIINNGEPIRLVMDGPGSAVQTLNTNYETDFTTGIGLDWVYLRNPQDGACEAGPEGLILRGNAYTLSDTANPAFLGIRQRDFSNQVEVDLTFSPVMNYEEAGFSIYYKNDAHLDIYVSRINHENFLFFRKVVGEIHHEAARIPLSSDKLTIRVNADKLEYKVYAIVNQAEIYLGKALTRYVSTEAHELGFTGVFYALYATGNGRSCETEALFTRFSYQGFDRDDTCL